MFSGIQEILLIVLIVLGIFLIPRMVNPRQSRKKQIVRRPIRKLSWKLRLGIVLSVLWPFSWAAHLKPWNNEIVTFIVIGIGPVALYWSVKWVLEGMKRK